MDEDAKLAEFSSVTGASAEEARHLLEATAWAVDAAVQLYFEAAAEPVRATAEPEFEAPVGSRGASAADAYADAYGAGPSDEVRRPDEVRRERLFDGPGGMYEMPYRRLAPSVDMPLRNFREEAQFHDGDDDYERGHTLAAIYRAPDDLMDDTPLGQCALGAGGAAEGLVAAARGQ